MKVDNVTPLVEAISKLCEVFKEGDVKFSPSAFSIIASNPSIGFFITLHIKEQYFTKFVNYFSISSEDLKLVIIELSLIDDASVFVTLTNSQVKFSVAAEYEIVLTKEVMKENFKFNSKSDSTERSLSLI
ncbi:unnamed protein product [Citrullus colocynthis]|uniref:Uncharacterized protein n=1 Tax=Citrullus colocynthis TaxID=252529 RepID=A0ABP0ZB03_9ROSI